MPRTLLGDKYSPPKAPRPKPDYIKALILERCAALGVDSMELAKAMGVSRTTLYERRRQPTRNWTFAEILDACRFLGVDLEDLRAAIRY